jgi:hypothetical protein
MDLMAKVHLLPKPTFHQALVATLENVNAARQYVLGVALAGSERIEYSRQRDLYRATYSELRTRFDIGAQISLIIINEIAGYAQRHELDNLHYTKHNPIAYDERSLSWQFEEKTISIWTFYGRKKGIAFECGPRQFEVLQQSRANSELVYLDNEFYVFTQCRVNQVKSVDLEDVWK